MIDLHLHSDASDGLLTPAELVRRASAAGLRAIALTDHDTFDGVAEALAEGERVGIEVVTGIELSAEHEPGTLHVIGLFLPLDEPRLTSLLERIRESRRARNRRIVQRLSELGVPIRIEDVAARSGRGIAGRPHIAAVLVEKGYAGTIWSAFDRYLGKSRPAYVERYRPTAEECIGAIHGAGGVSVLCHPFTLGLDAGDGPGTSPLSRFVLDLAGKGLDAIEVFTPEISGTQRSFCEAVAEQAGLLHSGGSDFHGYPRRSGGSGFARGIPYEVLTGLRERAARYQ